MSKPTLYGYWRSGASWRVRIALALKGIDYTYMPVNLKPLVGNVTEKLPEEYIQKNPMQQLPTLEIFDPTIEDTLKLTQSLAIIEYLDERYPDAPLLGTDPVTRARVRELSEIINSGTQPLQNLAMMRMITEWKTTPVLDSKFDEEEIATTGAGFAKFHTIKGLHAVETFLADYAGDYCVGSNVTLADLCLVPQLYSARRFKLDVEKYFPNCARVEARLAELDAFKAAHADTQPDAVL
jgi:maleylpyruvate isomerase